MTRFVALVCSLAWACQATANATGSANTAGTLEGQAQGQVQGQAQDTADGKSLGPQGTATRSRAGTSSTLEGQNEPEVEPSSVKPALFGARAGLHLAKPGQANCRCLSVAVGLPNDARMKWDGDGFATTLDPNHQVAIVLGAEGIDCPGAPKDAEGASYQGYQQEGADVVVLVEVARFGRPIARGAIIPKPAEGGRIVIRAVDKKTPYGRPLDSKQGDCIIASDP